MGGGGASDEEDNRLYEKIPNYTSVFLLYNGLNLKVAQPLYEGGLALRVVFI